MTEFKPTNPEGRHGQSPEELAALEQLRQQMNREASELLDAKEAQPQSPERSFQAHPDAQHLEHVDTQIINAKKEAPAPDLAEGTDPAVAKMIAELEQSPDKKATLNDWIRGVTEGKISPDAASEALKRLKLE